LTDEEALTARRVGQKKFQEHLGNIIRHAAAGAATELVTPTFGCEKGLLRDSKFELETTISSYILGSYRKKTRYK